MITTHISTFFIWRSQSVILIIFQNDRRLPSIKVHACDRFACRCDRLTCLWIINKVLNFIYTGGMGEAFVHTSHCPKQITMLTHKYKICGEMFSSISDTGDSEEKKSEFSQQEWNLWTFFFSSELPVSQIEENIISHLLTGFKIHHHIYIIVNTPPINIPVLAVCRMFVTWT